MFENVIVGVDGEQGGNDAIALAKQLVKSDGKLTLAHINMGYRVVAKGSSGDFDRAEHARSMALLQEALRESGLQVEVTAIGSPSIGRGLHQLAERHGADLLVVGSTAQGLAGRVWIGGETIEALTGAPCAVAVAPLGYSSGQRSLTRIGVGFDYSNESRHALEVGRQLASRFDATLSAWYAIEMPWFRSAGMREDIRTVMDEAKVELAKLGGVEPHVVYGRAGDELGFHSDAVDLLVIGSRDYGPVGRLVHGSTTRKLASSCRCPLLVLTRAAREAEPSGVLESDESLLEGVAVRAPLGLIAPASASRA